VPAWPSRLTGSASWSRSRAREAAVRPEISRPRLLAILADLYGGSTHVKNEGLEAADDDTVWEYAARHGLAIVSKDADFHQRSFLLGAPPKVIWIQRGNCATEEIAVLLRDRHADVLAFGEDETASFLALG
jgi:predicted nuclease of predicted toxin-antitoxin system